MRDGFSSILEYIGEDSAEAAAKVLDVVLQTAASLKVLSERGRVVPELQDPSLREDFVYSYRLQYQVTADEVRILGVLHGARDFDRWIRGKGAE